MSTSVAVTDSRRSNTIFDSKKNKGKIQLKTTGKKERTRPDKSEFKDFFFELDCVLKQLGYLKSRENSIKENDAENKVNKNRNGDFYYRLKNLYNKPLTMVKPRECCLNRRLAQSKTPVLNENSMIGKAKKEAMLPRKITVKRNSMNNLKCADLQKEATQTYGLGTRKPRLECGRCEVPAGEELPEDEEGFGELVRRYIGEELEDDVGAGGCGCGERVVFSGTSTLGDLGRGLAALASSHTVASVVLTLRKPNQNVDEDVDTKEKAKFCKKTPAILTKFGLNSICEQVGAHPSLKSLRIERVPLSQPCQAMLVPSFATLRELRLIGNRLGDDGAGRICRFAWRSTQLRVLDLSQNGLGREGAGHLARMLERRAAAKAAGLELAGLEKIILNRNPIGYEGFCELLNSAGKALMRGTVEGRDCGLDSEEAARLCGLELLDLRPARGEAL